MEDRMFERVWKTIKFLLVLFLFVLAGISGITTGKIVSENYNIGLLGSIGIGILTFCAILFICGLFGSLIDGENTNTVTTDNSIIDPNFKTSHSGKAYCRKCGEEFTYTDYDCTPYLCAKCYGKPISKHKVLY